MYRIGILVLSVLCFMAMISAIFFTWPVKCFMVFLEFWKCLKMCLKNDNSMIKHIIILYIFIAIKHSTDNTKIPILDTLFYCIFLIKSCTYWEQGLLLMILQIFPLKKFLLLITISFTTWRCGEIVICKILSPLLFYNLS